MSKGILTPIQKDIIHILRAVGTTKEKIISIMPLVEDHKIADLVADKILKMYDSGEQLTEAKIIKLMAKVYNEN